MAKENQPIKRCTQRLYHCKKKDFYRLLYPFVEYEIESFLIQEWHGHPINKYNLYFGFVQYLNTRLYQ